MVLNTALYHKIPAEELSTSRVEAQAQVEDTGHSSELHSSRPWKTVIFLVGVILFQSTFIAIKLLGHTACSSTSSVKYSAGLHLALKHDRVADTQDSRFWSGNDTASSIAWESIETGHGVVALTQEHAASIGLPETNLHPFETEKHLYVLASYHAIHCLQWLRRHHLALEEGLPVTWSWEHDMHCFDSVRQHVMCHADDTLLTTNGNREVGHGQHHQCKDWDALRDWATEYSACYKDYGYPKPTSRWGVCDGGEDGLPRGSLLD